MARKFKPQKIKGGLRNNKMKNEIGAFCEIIGDTPRNRILEFFVAGIDCSSCIAEVIEETELNRATAYNAINQLIKEGYLIQTKKIGGAQLYSLDKEKKEVKLLRQLFLKVLKEIIEESEEKYLIKA